MRIEAESVSELGKEEAPRERERGWPLGSSVQACGEQTVEYEGLLEAKLVGTIQASRRRERSSMGEGVMKDMSEARRRKEARALDGSF
jgi:hypothetical protein